MLNFTKVETVTEPKPAKMSMEEYVGFCEMCLKGNRRITPENCMQRGEGIKIPFTLGKGGGPLESEMV